MHEQVLTAIITASVGLATVAVNLAVLRHERRKTMSTTRLELERLQWERESYSLGRRAEVTGGSERRVYEEKIGAYKSIVAETARMNGLLREAYISK